MIKLIKLELIKNKISVYLVASLCILIFCESMCFMMGLIPIIEQHVPTPAGVDMELFHKWNNFIALISVLSTMAFSIMSAVMHTKFTVEEYVGKRAILLFSYPQSRSRILFAKCSLVFFFTIAALMVCNMTAIIFFGLSSNLFSIMPEPFGISIIPDLLIKSGVCGLLAGGVGLVAMRVGFWKKSLVATVVTSVILIAPFGNLLSYFMQYTNGILLVGMVVLLIIGLAVFLGLLKKVNHMEAAT